MKEEILLNLAYGMLSFAAGLLFLLLVGIVIWIYYPLNIARWKPRKDR